MLASDSEPPRLWGAKNSGAAYLETAAHEIQFHNIGLLRTTLTRVINGTFVRLERELLEMGTVIADIFPAVKKEVEVEYKQWNTEPRVEQD